MPIAYREVLKLIKLIRLNINIFSRLQWEIWMIRLFDK